MNGLRKLLVIPAIAVTLITAACEKQEGPAERAGREIDKAADDTGDAMRDAGKKLGEKMEDAGEKMQEGVNR